MDATYFISFFSEEVMEISPWYEKEVMFLRQNTYNAQTQTAPTHGYLLDRSAQTETLNFEVFNLVILEYTCSLVDGGYV